MELLKQLYQISSPSRDEQDMFSFICNWMGEHKMECNVHEWGITCVKGLSDTYPCIVAHMDEVHKRHPYKRIIETDGIVFGYDVNECAQCGIGADDKNGIWVALKMFERLDAVKVAFFVGEEIGCVGSSRCDMNFFDDCRFVIQCDRRNGGDFITDAGFELCSKEFTKACKINKFGYHEEHGLMTDVLELKERGLKVSAVNLSCGYYNPHTATEYTELSELQNCLDFVEWICRNLTDVYSHEASYYGYGYYGYGYGRVSYNWWDSKPKKSNSDGCYYDIEKAKDFIYNEICWYDNIDKAPAVDEMFKWWQNYTSNKGIGKKKFKKAYDEVVEKLDEDYGFCYVHEEMLN